MVVNLLQLFVPKATVCSSALIILNEMPRPVTKFSIKGNNLCHIRKTFTYPVAEQ